MQCINDAKDCSLRNSYGGYPPYMTDGLGVCLDVPTPDGMAALADRAVVQLPGAAPRKADQLSDFLGDPRIP
jgi:hypothetical protein